MKSIWETYRIQIQIVPLYLLAFTAPFSISLSQLFFGISLLAWLIDWMYGNEPRKVWSSPLRPLLLVFAVWFLYRFGHLFAAESFMKEAINMREVWLMLAVPLLYRNLREPKQINSFLFLLLAGLFITAIFNIVYFFSIGMDPNFRARGFNNNNALTYAGMVGLLLMAGVGFSVAKWKEWQELNSATGRKEFFLAGVLTLFALFSLILAGSGGVILSAGIALILYLLLLFRKKALLLLPILLLIPVLLVFSSNRVKGILVDISSGNYPKTIQERIYLWQTGLRIVQQHPVFGTGGSDYHKIYMKNRVPEITPDFKVAYNGSHQHNDFLDTLAHFGIVGLPIFLLFFLVPLYHFFQWYRKHGHDSPSRFLLLSLGTNIALFIMMAMGQCHFTDDEVQLLFWLNIGIMYNLMSSEDGTSVQ